MKLNFFQFELQSPLFLQVDSNCQFFDSFGLIIQSTLFLIILLILIRKIL